MEKTYTVELSLTFEAESPQQAAESFLDWINSTKCRTVTVTDEDTGTTTSHDV